MKLGALLIQDGLISSSQLDQALNAQHVFGGKLGTNLIELGFVDDESLAQTLSKQFQVPLIRQSEFEQIDPSILALVPRKAVETLFAIPVKMEGETLLIAMADPSDTKILTRISANLGKHVTAKVALEVELRYAMEKYYGIPRAIRHIQAHDALQKKKVARAQKSPLESFLESNTSLENSLSFFSSESGRMNSTPKRIANDQDIQNQNLRPEVSYLLYQIDGQTTVEDLLALMPMKKGQSLRILHYLHEKKMIALT